MLTISVAVHNNWHLTKRFLASVLQFTKVPYRLVVTDNASTDETKDELEKMAAEERTRFPMEIVRKETNTGFSEPHRQAFSKADGEFFAVMNNDLEVCQGWAEEMLLPFQEDEKVVQVGLKRTCCALDNEGTGMPSNDEPEYMEASFMIVRAPVVRRLPGGLFDPIFRFAYYEDSDLSLRIRVAGFKIRAVDLPITHLGAATARIVRNVDLDGYKLRNKHVFQNRWGSYLKGRVTVRVAKDRIVVRRGGARGDVIMTTPVVRALRKKYPKSHIVISTACPDVYQGNPDINEVTVQGPPLRKTDLVYNLDMAYENRPDVHPMQSYADICDVKLEDWRPQLYPGDTSRILAEQRMPSGPRYAIIHPGIIPGWAGRQWPHQRFREVVAKLKTRGYKTIVIGSDGTPDVGSDLDYRNVAFAHMVALMERAQLFVGLDSMPFHVAQACDVPAVALFGCVDPELRIAPGARALGVVAKGVGCLGCHSWLPAPRTVTASCMRNTNACMENLLGDDVLEAVDKLTQNLASVV